MKKFCIVCFAAIFSALLQDASGQGFANLDFESANVSGHSPGDEVSTSVALPSWTAYFSNSSDQTASSLSMVGYDGLSLGPAFISLEDSNAPNGTGGFSLFPMQGNYSIFLQGSQGGVPFPPGTSTSIGQIGTIPNTAQSLTFLAILGGNFQVTFDGQNISYSAVGSGANYTIYGADISNYAGQTGQLLFTALNQTSTLLDNIQFSSSAVPEPSEFALSGLGTLLLGLQRWTKRR
jgi:hypothetical protein